MNNSCPILGEPKRVFEGENVYVVNEKAEIGRKYSFVCPSCHALFFGKAKDTEVTELRCPECNTIICITGTPGSAPKLRRHVTLVQSTEESRMAAPGMLVWMENQQVSNFVLMPGTISIGRDDEEEPSDISLADARASRRSVEIEVTRGEQTGWYIFKLTVLRTTNAVYVNHNALYSGNSIYLNYGDTLKVGTTVFTLMACQQ